MTTRRISIKEMATVLGVLPSSIRVAAQECGYRVTDDCIEDFPTDSSRQTFYARLVRQPTNAAQRILRDLKQGIRQ